MSIPPKRVAILYASDRSGAGARYKVADPLIAAGLPLAIVLPGVVYGPGDTSSVRTTIRQYLRSKLPAIPARTDFSWAHVEDIAHGHILAMEAGKPGENYIIAGPEHTLMDALEIAEGITGIPAPRLHIPPVAMKGVAAMMGIMEKTLSVPPNYSAEYLRVGAGTTYIGDNTKARRELGYAPRPLEEGLRETLHHEMTLLGMPIP